jgi:hypothetical protein
VESAAMARMEWDGVLTRLVTGVYLGAGQAVHPLAETTNLVEAPHRFTRDIDVLRRHGPPDPNDLRMRVEAVVSGELPDRITWGRVWAIQAVRIELKIIPPLDAQNFTLS